MEKRLEMHSPAAAGANAQATITRQPRGTQKELVTWWQLFENGAKSRFGPDIEVLRTKKAEDELIQFVRDLEFTVIRSNAEPQVTRPTIIDITMKELVNLGEKEKDESVIRVGKNEPICAGTRYHFSTSEGISFDPKYNFGARIVSLAMVGGFMRVGGDTGNMARDRGYNMGLQFNYSQEEKIIVPPRMKVKVKIITSTKKFRQDYTLEFNTPRTRYIMVSYLTKCQQSCRDNCCCFFGCGCCCCQPKQGAVFAGDILRTLPEFRDGGGICSFTQSGTLTWVGETCNLEKTEVFV